MKSIEYAFKIVSFRDFLNDEVSFDNCEFVHLVPLESFITAKTELLVIAKDDFGVMKYIDQEPEIGDKVFIRIKLTK